MSHLLHHPLTTKSPERRLVARHHKAHGAENESGEAYVWILMQAQWRRRSPGKASENPRNEW